MGKGVSLATPHLWHICQLMHMVPTHTPGVATLAKPPLVVWPHHMTHTPNYAHGTNTYPQCCNTDTATTSGVACSHLVSTWLIPRHPQCRAHTGDNTTHYHLPVHAHQCWPLMWHLPIMWLYLMWPSQITCYTWCSLVLTQLIFFPNIYNSPFLFLPFVPTSVQQRKI